MRSRPLGDAPPTKATLLLSCRLFFGLSPGNGQAPSNVLTFVFAVTNAMAIILVIMTAIKNHRDAACPHRGRCCRCGPIPPSLLLSSISLRYPWTVDFICWHIHMELTNNIGVEACVGLADTDGFIDIHTSQHQSQYHRRAASRYKGERPTLWLRCSGDEFEQDPTTIVHCLTRQEVGDATISRLTATFKSERAVSGERPLEQDC